VQEARRLPFASRRCGLEAPPSLDGRASLHFSLGAVRSPNIGPCAPCGASPPVPWAAQLRGPVNGVRICLSLRARRIRQDDQSFGLALLARPWSLSLPATGGDAPQGAHGWASPPKPNGSGDPFLRWRKNCFWLPPALRWPTRVGARSGDCARFFSLGCVAPKAENCLSRQRRLSCLPKLAYAMGNWRHMVVYISS